MIPRAGHRRPLRALCLALALAGCAGAPVPPDASWPSAGARTPVAAPPPPAPAGPSEESRALRRHYAALESSLLARGLLRTDGGGVDTPFTDTDLARNFERIAFYDEYARDGGLRSAPGEPGRLRRWTVPVRFAVEFGRSVPPERRARDLRAVSTYVERLARITGHPMAMATRPSEANFHVFVVSEDDRDELVQKVRRLVPGLDPAAAGIFRHMPREIHCFVAGFSAAEGSAEYASAIAVIRDEHPELLRLSCIHEEIAQGLGLANDSPTARPSIFNDDDEFALLTAQDELLLKMLYHPALKPGMTLDEARPVIRWLARELMRQRAGG